MNRLLLSAILVIAISSMLYASVEQPEPVAEKVRFFGFHGHMMPSGEYIAVQRHIFRQLLPADEFPVNELNPVFYTGALSFMRNWFYGNFTFSYTPDDYATDDIYKSRIWQESYALRLGYNVFRNNYMVISPYGGIRYTKFRQMTGLRHRRIQLDEYLETRNIDLRLSQLSAETGVSINFVLQRRWSIGVNAAWLHDLHKNAFIHTPENRITGQYPGNPVRHLMIGLGFGYGIHDFTTAVERGKR
jgi:hypothetical protein